MTILLTGGSGYIGVHTALTLLQLGYDIVVVDSLVNSCLESIKRIEEFVGRDIPFYHIDIRCKSDLIEVFSKHDISSVIHFAGLKSVGESIQKPLVYYRNNLDATLTLLECMNAVGVRKIVFSSSATVYGGENAAPYVETMPRGRCSNPYGWTKAMIEQIILDAAVAMPEMSAVLLRYFNPIGAHESGRIGEDPSGIPNNLMPYVTQVAVGKREYLTVFGNDYPTHDGTCLRDYIHVMDLAEGHVKAVEYADEHKGVEIFNLGTGTPYSVLEVVNTFERCTGVKVKYKIGPRREGDLPACWADTEKAQKHLNWKAKRTLADMCRDAWNWQKNNPDGYR